jgi:WS/DGAT/MGAT family acyltransferase
MKRLSPIDAAFLRMESPRTPMHIGALLTFKLPDDAPRDFARQLLQNMREQPYLPFPFGCKLQRSRLARVLPAWEECEPDMDYHLRHAALPYPGGERELGQLVARLHSHPMDLSRPPWECTLIEGLEGNRFAAYFKAHHAAVDGMGAMKLIKGWLSYDPNHRGGPRMKPESANDDSLVAVAGNTVKKALDFTGLQLRSTRELVRNLREMSKGGDESVIRASIGTPRTVFNVPTSQPRRLGTQILPLER